MVLTRDPQTGSVDASDAAASWLPAGAEPGVPDGDTYADAGGVDGADEAASSDATAEADPYADIPPDLLTRHEQEIAQREAEVWQQRVSELHRIKNTEQKAVNKTNVRLRAELAARDAYIREHAQEWGLSEGDIAILTNKVRTAGDGAEAHYQAVSERYDQQLAWANDRLNANLAETVGAAGQRGYDHRSDPAFQSLWAEAQKQLGQWVMAGEPEDGRLLATQRAFDAVKAYLATKGPAPVSTPNGRTTPPPSADQRAKRQATGPAAPARTGGTGRGMDTDRAWEQARTAFPDDPRKQFREALRLQEASP